MMSMWLGFQTLPWMHRSWQRASPEVHGSFNTHIQSLKRHTKDAFCHVLFVFVFTINMVYPLHKLTLGENVPPFPMTSNEL